MGIAASPLKNSTQGHKAAGRQGFPRRWLQIVLLGGIIVLATGLRLYRLGAHSIGNGYYAATVQSMLTSWHNFFFASFEPGGSVTVDKPPLGFWVQAASAWVWGVNGFALAWPQAVTGTLAVPLLYVLVRRQFGTSAGLVAALTLALFPIAVATERNNTVDGQLAFVLLLAAWALWKSLYTEKYRYLLLCAFLVGLGFNIKMMQALMPLPAFYLIYLIGAKPRLGKRIVNLIGATVLLVAVSLSWAIVVDLTPPDRRPFIGSSADNRVMSLIWGHNALERLRSPFRRGPGGIGQPGPLPPGGFPPGVMPPGGLPPGAPPGQPPVRQPGGRSEVGDPGLLRLVTDPLATESGWLLPLLLLSVPVLVWYAGRSVGQNDKCLALIFWSAWLLPEMAYFSFTTGIWHAYYLIMLGAPLAALIGASFAAWMDWVTHHRPSGLIALILALVVTLVFQVWMVGRWPDHALWTGIGSGTLLAVGMALGLIGSKPALRRAAVGVVMLSAMVGPGLWCILTALNPTPDVWLPYSGPYRGEFIREPTLRPEQRPLLRFLLDHSPPDGYLLATVNAVDAAPFILETRRPVLAMGGFSGGDRVVDLDGLIRMVRAGRLRFILDQDLRLKKPDIARWVEGHCVVAIELSPPGGGPGPRGILYDCGQARTS